MITIRQTSLNLFAVGLFHLLEQQLADLCRDSTFGVEPPSDTALKNVSIWYYDNFDLDLSSLFIWPKIEQLRLLSNTVKHGEGVSATKLRSVRPDLFINPNLCELWRNFPEMIAAQNVRMRLAGEDIFVTTDIFSEFCLAANSLFTEIAEFFGCHENEEYPLC